MSRYFDSLNALTCGRSAVFALIASVSLAAISALAQTPDCSPDDASCLVAEYERACRTTPVSDAATCAAWLEGLESHEYATEPQWLLIAGSAHRALARMNEDTAAAEESVAESRTYYLRVLDYLESGPLAADAWLGLALVADGEDEMRTYLRRAVEADPENGMYIEFLARVIYADGDIAAAGGLMEDAFANHSGGNRWRQAAQAIGLHRAAGRAGQADDLLQRVLAESGLERIAEQAAEGFSDAAGARAAIQIACNDSLINLFGGDACLASIDAAAAAALSHEDAQQQRGFAEAVTAGFWRAVNSHRLLAEGAVSESMYDAVYEAFLDKGIESSVVLEAYSNRLADRRRALELVERAIALNPEDGDLWLRLGITQLEVGHEDDAIESLNQAQSLLPASRGVIIDHHMQRAEAMRATAAPADR